MARVAVPAPLPDIAPHATPHKPLYHGLEGRPRPRVVEVVDGIESVPGECRGDNWARPAGGDVAPKVAAVILYQAGVYPGLP